MFIKLLQKINSWLTNYLWKIEDIERQKRHKRYKK
jgi:hypothetical protein